MLNILASYADFLQQVMLHHQLMLNVLLNYILSVPPL